MRAFLRPGPATGSTGSAAAGDAEPGSGGRPPASRASVSVRGAGFPP